MIKPRREGDDHRREWPEEYGGEQNRNPCDRNMERPAKIDTTPLSSDRCNR
jgi:hypothetical protein